MQAIFQKKWVKLQSPILRDDSQSICRTGTGLLTFFYGLNYTIPLPILIIFKIGNGILVFRWMKGFFCNFAFPCYIICRSFLQGKVQLLTGGKVRERVRWAGRHGVIP